MEAILDGNLNTGADNYKKVIRCLRRHMVGPDLKAWQVRHSRRRPCPPTLPSRPMPRASPSLARRAPSVPHAAAYRMHARPPSPAGLPSFQQLVLASLNEMSNELKVLAHSGASTGITYRLQRESALSKHDNPRDKASATIGLYWRNRMTLKNARVRMDALLKIQEDLLISAVNQRVESGLSVAPQPGSPASASSRPQLGPALHLQGQPPSHLARSQRLWRRQAAPRPPISRLPTHRSTASRRIPRSCVVTSRPAA